MTKIQTRPLSELMDSELIVLSANGSEILYEGLEQFIFILKSKEDKLEKKSRSAISI